MTTTTTTRTTRTKKVCYRRSMCLYPKHTRNNRPCIAKGKYRYVFLVHGVYEHQSLCGTHFRVAKRASPWKNADAWCSIQTLIHGSSSTYRNQINEATTTTPSLTTQTTCVSPPPDVVDRPNSLSPFSVYTREQENFHHYLRRDDTHPSHDAIMALLSTDFPMYTDENNNGNDYDGNTNNTTNMTSTNNNIIGVEDLLTTPSPSPSPSWQPPPTPSGSPPGGGGDDRCSSGGSIQYSPPMTPELYQESSPDSSPGGGGMSSSSPDTPFMNQENERVQFIRRMLPHMLRLHRLVPSNHGLNSANAYSVTAPTSPASPTWEPEDEQYAREHGLWPFF